MQRKKTVSYTHLDVYKRQSEFVTRLYENVPYNSGDMHVEWEEGCVDQGILYYNTMDHLKKGRTI